ncbi:hypothetical protein [Nocardia sp. CA-120079]
MAEPALMDSLRGSPTNWGKYRFDDEAGVLNHPTAEEVLREVRR